MSSIEIKYQIQCQRRLDKWVEDFGDPSTFKSSKEAHTEYNKRKAELSNPEKIRLVSITTEHIA